MPHTFVSLLVHVVFSTKDRAPDLSPELANRLFPYMGGIVKELKGSPLIVNGPADHVHLLLSIPATTSIADLLRVLKANRALVRIATSERPKPAGTPLGVGQH